MYRERGFSFDDYYQPLRSLLEREWIPQRVHSAERDEYAHLNASIILANLHCRRQKYTV